LITDASGFANVLLRPQYIFRPYTFPSAATGNAVSAWTNFPAATTIAGISDYRIVSCGAIVRRIAAPLTSSGVVYFNSYSTTPSSLALVNTDTFNASNTRSLALQDCKDVPIIFQRDGSLPSVWYYDTAAAVVNLVPNGFNPITIGVSGGPASAGVLEIEFITHYELRFPDDQGLAQLGVPGPMDTPALSNAASVVRSKLSAFLELAVDRVGGYVADKASKALVNMLPPPARAVARIVN
jgi:hypothetical protein